MTWSGKEKSYSMEPWLRYVIDHFLRKGAHAADDARFAEFTFDDELTGTLVGCRRDNKERMSTRITVSLPEELVEAATAAVASLADVLAVLTSDPDDIARLDPTLAIVEV